MVALTQMWYRCGNGDVATVHCRLEARGHGLQPPARLHAGHGLLARLPPPPLLVQATVNDQKLTEPTPSVAWTRVLLTRRNLRDTRVHLRYYSENQEVKHSTNALLANRAALTQNMNFLLLKTKVSGGSVHSSGTF